MCANGLLWYAAGMACAASTACMGLTTYVKLSRLFAVKLFSISIGHYTAVPLYPRYDSTPIGHGHAITASIRLALTHALQQHPLLATQTWAVVTTTCLDYLHSHTLVRIPGRCAHPRPHRYTSAPAINGYWVWRPRPSLSPRHGNTRCSRLKPRQFGNHDMPIHGLTDIPLAYCQRVLGVVHSPLALAETLQHPLLATQTSAVATTKCPDYLHSHT
jgi:hypothetical protein